MEIERKWLVNTWPSAGFPQIFAHEMRQGYISVFPTVRIREEKKNNGTTEYVLCFKSGAGLVRKEIEMLVEEDKFAELEDLIGLPLVPKTRKTFELPGGLRLEVNHVDAGAPTEFWYAEVEFETEEQAKAWDPAEAGLADYLSNEVTGQVAQSMSAYWVETRLKK